MTLKKLRKVLEQEGVSEIPDPEGKAFDPSFHNAIAAEEREDVAESTVIEQIRKGYMLRGKSNSSQHCSCGSKTKTIKVIKITKWRKKQNE